MPSRTTHRIPRSLPPVFKKLAIAGLILLTLLASLALPLKTTHAQENGVVVEGLVVNGSPGSPSTAGLVVTFHQDNASQHEHLETPTDAEGRFRFESIIPDPFVVYGVSVRYQDALYGTDIDLLNGPPPSMLLEIFEVSNDQQIIHANSASVLFADINKETGTIAVLEMVQLANDSDYTYVAGDELPMDLLRFGLPPDASSLQVDTRLLGADVVQVDRGFAVLAAVPPGNHDIMYTYEFPYVGTEHVFTKSLPFGAEGLRILSPDDVLTISGEDLGPPEKVTIGSSPYQLLEQIGLDRGTRVDVTLSNLPQASFPERMLYAVKTVRAEILAPALLGIPMLVLTGFAIRRHRNRQIPLEDGPAPTTAEGDRFTLQRMISQLEQDYESGEVAAESYHRRRRVLETRLQSVGEI
jgi:hypothetical protein